MDRIKGVVYGVAVFCGNVYWGMLCPTDRHYGKEIYATRCKFEAEVRAKEAKINLQEDFPDYRWVVVEITPNIAPITSYY